MQSIKFELLAKICETPGAPGFEERVRNFLIKELTGYTDELHTDAMGNLVAIVRGHSDKKLMLAAHMDEISFVVTHIDDKGFVRFQPLGGFDPKTLTAQRVIIHGKEDIIGVMGCKPIHVMTAEERKKHMQLEDYFIDTGLPAEEVKKKIEIGSPVTRERDTIRMGKCINGKSLDNRVSVYILLETIKELKEKNLPHDVYGVFTVQEEVGIRGATSATQIINPDFGLAIDTTIAFDLPDAQAHQQITKLGEGTAIKILDGHTICDQRMVSFLKQTCAQHKIKWQAEVLPRGGTDTMALQRYSNKGCIAGAVSIPTRNLHQVIEMVHEEDVVASVNLLVHAIQEMGEYDWSHL